MTTSDLGTLKQHLGVDWTFGVGEDEHGRFLESSMPAFINSIVKDYEKYMENHLELSKPLEAQEHHP